MNGGRALQRRPEEPDELRREREEATVAGRSRNRREERQERREGAAPGADRRPRGAPAGGTEAGPLGAQAGLGNAAVVARLERPPEPPAYAEGGDLQAGPGNAGRRPRVVPPPPSEHRRDVGTGAPGREAAGPPPAAPVARHDVTTGAPAPQRPGPPPAVPAPPPGPAAAPPEAAPTPQAPVGEPAPGAAPGETAPRGTAPGEAPPIPEQPAGEAGAGETAAPAQLAAPPPEPAPAALAVAPPALASPVLQEAARQIIVAAETETAALRQAAAGQREVVRQRTLAIVAELEAEGQAVLAGLRATLAARRVEIREAFTVARSRIGGDLEAAVAAAEAEGERAQAALTAEIETQRAAAIDAAERQAGQLETFGRESAERARGAGGTTEGAIDSAASSAVAGVGPVEPDVRSHVRAEVDEVARSAGDDATSRADEVADNAVEAATTGAEGIREAGQELATSLGSEGSSDVVTGIEEGTQATVLELQGAAQQQMARLDQLEAQAESAVAQAEAQLAPAVERITAAAIAQAQGVGDSLLARIDEAAAGGSDALAEGARQAIDQLQEVPEPETAEDRQAISAYAVGAVAELGRARVLAAAEIDAVAPDLEAALGQLRGEATSSLEEHRVAVEGELSELAAGTRSGADEAVGSFAAAASTAAADLAQANQQAITDYAGTLGQQISEAEQGWIESREEVEAGIREDVDTSLREQEQLRAEMPTELTTTARDAAAYAQASLLDKILSGIWEGVKNFFTGLLWFALAVLVVWGALMLGAALLGVALAAGKALLIALVIVGAAFLIYGFVMAMIHRSRDFWAKWGTDIPWWGQVLGFFLVFTVAIGDVFGVSGILEGIFGIDLVTWEDLDPKERARRATEGVLTIAFILLLRGAIKKLGGGRGVKPPAERPPRPAPPERPPAPAPPERPPGPVPPERPPGPELPERPPGPERPERPPGPEPPERPPGPRGELPKSWEKFASEHHPEFRARLRDFRGNEDLNPDFSGGEGRIFWGRAANPLRALKRWFQSRLKDMPESLRRLRDVASEVDADPTLKANTEVVRIHETGSDWILRDFDPASIPLRDALGDTSAAAARTRIIDHLEGRQAAGTLSSTLRMLLKKIKKDPPSENLHWSPTNKKVVVIDMQ